MRNKMNMKNKTHKCVPRNSQINLSAQEFELLWRGLQKGHFFSCTDYDVLFMGKMDSRDSADGAETCKIWK